MNDSYKMQIIMKNAIIDYYLEEIGTAITIDNVYVVWYSKTLQNHKALLSTTNEDGLYFECTYNGDKEEMYLDVYEKIKNKVINSKRFNDKIEF